MSFIEKLKEKWNQRKFVCIGLDSELGKIPQTVHCNVRERPHVVDVASTMVAFNMGIVDETKDVALAYKPNLAFYIAHGAEGLCALRDTVRYIHNLAPNVPVILDAKDMDIGNTNAGYIQMAFQYCAADAITVNPYLGMEAAQPFLDQKDKGVIILCRTSNPGAGEFQDLSVSVVPGRNIPLYQYVAMRVANDWNKNNNCALVVGATYPEELSQVRNIVGDMPILIPGIGAQGGDLEATVNAGKDSRNQGMIINSSRGIIFASNDSDFAEAARQETIKLNNSINRILNV